MKSDDGRRLLVNVEADLSRFGRRISAASDEQLMELRRRARAAIDRLDDEPELERAHQALDRAGKLVRENRPRLCLFTPDGDDFQQTCPVALGHIRLGMSIGAEIEESECSICGRDSWDCAHVPGRVYGEEVATRIITKAKILHVAVVQRPDFPDARFMSEPVSRDRVESVLGMPLAAGEEPVCDRCLSPCPGLRDALLPE